MGEEWGGVKSHLGVGRDQLAVAREHARIDLQQRSVRVDEGAIEGLKKGGRVRGDLAGKSQSKREFARLKRLEATPRMNRLPTNGFRIFLGQFVNFHASRGAGHETGKPAGTIDKQAKIQLALDVQPFLDQHALDDAARRSRLRSNERHAQDVPGNILGFISRARQLYAPALAAAPGVNLRFYDNNVRLQALCGLTRLFLGVSHLATRRGHAVARKDGLGLILVNLHRASISARICAPQNKEVYSEAARGARNAAKWPQARQFC